MKQYERKRVCVFGVPVLLLMITAVFSGFLAPYDPYEQNLAQALQAPCRQHLMGTDRYGRDLFSRVLVGGRTSIFSALFLVAVIFLLGTVVGLLCGFYGGWADAVIMRLSDVCLAFPGLVLALAIAALLNGGIGSAVLALAVTGWPKYARLARSRTLTEKSLEYVEAARLLGVSDLRLMFVHILPNILGPLIVTASTDVGTMMMELAGLSFLGLGAQPPVPEWGNMMSEGSSMLQIYPWLVLAPGLAMFAAVSIFNLFGDAVREFFSPQADHISRSRRKKDEEDQKMEKQDPNTDAGSCPGHRFGKYAFFRVGG